MADTEWTNPPEHDNETDEPVVTTDPNTGMNSSYVVLTEAERAKGFVRPVRKTYVHTGKRPKHPTRELTDEEKERYAGVGFVAFEEYPEGSHARGRFWTEAELNSGCGAATTMGDALAETYARDPKFYGSTYCVGCRDHHPVGEFTWDGTDEVVGS